uniref:Uncharacterized protein n=1 Tax=Ditylenchus dipsaci TaxID=166011 RepID=A0A915D9Z8_9BILA
MSQDEYVYLPNLNWAHKPWDRELRDDLLARI